MPLQGISFALVGTAKVGTTTLEHVLRSCGDVALVAGRKLIFGSGHDVHERAQAAAQIARIPDRQIIGHIRADYARDESALRDLSQQGVRRLIYTYRNPARRLYSHFQHDRKKGRAPSGFDAWLQSEKGRYAWQLSMYGACLERMLRHFDRSDIFLMAVEETSDPERLAALLRFIGSKQAGSRVPSAPRRNVSQVPRWEPASRAFDGLLRLSHPKGWVRRIMYRLRDRLLIKDERAPELAKDKEIEILTCFADDIARFNSLSSFSTKYL